MQNASLRMSQRHTRSFQTRRSASSTIWVLALRTSIQGWEGSQVGLTWEAWVEWGASTHHKYSRCSWEVECLEGWVVWAAGCLLDLASVGCPVVWEAGCLEVLALAECQEGWAEEAHNNRHLDHSDGPQLSLLNYPVIFYFQHT